MMLSVIHSPPLRIATLLAVLALGVSAVRLESVLGLLIMGGVWLAAGGVPARFFWRRLRVVAPLLLFMLLFFPLIEGAAGWTKAAMYAGRLLFAVQVLTLLFHRLPPALFFQSLLRLRVPDVFVEMMQFTLRYIDLFRSEAVGMMRGCRSRGFKPSSWLSLRSFAVLSKVVGSLLLRVLRRSERVYLGMLSRGYRGVPAMGELPARRPGDVWKAAWMGAVALALCIWGNL